MSGSYNNNNDRDTLFPGGAATWAGYTPGTHSVYSPPPRFPYTVPSRGYTPGGVVHGPPSYLAHRSYSPSSYDRLDLGSGGRRATGALSPRRSYYGYEEDEVAASDPVVLNAGVTFRLGRESHVHRHLHVQPAHATPEAPSAALTRQIDRFLRKSDHTLDRFRDVVESRSSSTLGGPRCRSVTPAGGTDSPDMSLALRIIRSTSAASIAVKADKHLEGLGPVGRLAAAAITEHDEDHDHHDPSSSSSDDGDDLSDDTSVDLSQVSGPGSKPSNDQRSAPCKKRERHTSSSSESSSLQEVLDAKVELLTKERLAEVTADLSEEHSTAHLAGERLEAEQAERMKLEKEMERLQNNMQMITCANGKLEMEKQALQSEVLNGEAEHDEDEAADASLYRRKYEWCLREIELLKKQLKQQQEDDLEHLLILKKQLEKKVADAYEETEEQRQVVAQVKRKSQRVQAEMNDLKILLEEQTSRNNLLEKKQRKFDQDMMAVQEELRHERANKDKLQREKDQALAEKYSFEQEVLTLKLELDLKEEKLTALNRKLDDLNFTGKAEEEVALLKKARHDLELRVKDQEEELDDLAGQVQMLEGAKVRLEMSIEQMRKENRREVSQREEELEEVRLSSQKKVKVLESQLENEHEERTLLVREKHELERRVAELQERAVGHVDEEYVHKLKKELKKTKALLRDTQTMLEKSQQEGGHKLLVRQLKTQLEDAEFAKTAAIKARQCAEADLAELTSQLEEAQRVRKEAEDKCTRVAKDRTEIQTQLEESEEEVAEVMKKYKAVVSQLSVDQITLSEQSQQISELEHEKQVLHERLMELSSKVEVLEGETANIHTQRRLEMKIKEVESKLELEQTTRQRLESQIGRLKDQLERVSGECDAARQKESQAVEHNKRITRQLREAKEDLAALQQKHTEAVNKKGEIEKQLEFADSEVLTLKSDLKLAFKRIEDLQQAIQGDLNDSDSELSDRMDQTTSPCGDTVTEDYDESTTTRESFA